MRLDRATTPEQFEALYHKTRVEYRDPIGFFATQTVDVNIYRQTSANASFPEKDAIIAALDRDLRRPIVPSLGVGDLPDVTPHDVSTAMEVTGAFVPLSGVDATRAMPLLSVDHRHRSMVSLAFYGKGSPEDCAIALHYAVRYKRTTPQQLQIYCDQTAKIGADCSGFVNSYFRSTGVITADHPISEYGHGKVGKGKVRDALADLRPRDVLVWADRAGNVLGHPKAHIALLASTPSANGAATVVEAAASLGGITHSTYVFTLVTKGVYQVKRRTSMDHVRVVSVADP